MEEEETVRVVGVPRCRTYSGKTVQVTEAELGGEKIVVLVLDSEATFGEACRAAEDAQREWPEHRVFAHAGHLDPEGMTADQLREAGLERMRNGTFL